MNWFSSRSARHTPFIVCEKKRNVFNLLSKWRSSKINSFNVTARPLFGVKNVVQITVFTTHEATVLVHRGKMHSQICINSFCICVHFIKISAHLMFYNFSFLCKRYTYFTCVQINAPKTDSTMGKAKTKSIFEDSQRIVRFGRISASMSTMLTRNHVTFWRCPSHCCLSHKHDNAISESNRKFRLGKFFNFRSIRIARRAIGKMISELVESFIGDIYLVEPAKSKCISLRLQTHDSDRLQSNDVLQRAQFNSRSIGINVRSHFVRTFIK